MSIEDAEELLKVHRRFAVDTNNRALDLLEAPQRTEDENREMLAMAFSSWYHWKESGTTLNVARADGVVSRALSALGEGVIALRYADRYHQVCVQETTSEDFDLAFAHQAQARAYAALGDNNQFSIHYAKTIEAIAAIQDPEEREIVEKDLELEPWYGMRS